jgi:hypothetical protein
MRLAKKATIASMVASAAAATAIVGGIASPAFAGSTSCTTPFWYKSYRTCTTGTIGPSGQHKIWIDASACAGSPWKVWDTGTGVTIASGAGSVSNKVVGGLYGNYKAKLTHACWRDTIALAS